MHRTTLVVLGITALLIVAVFSSAIAQEGASDAPAAEAPTQSGVHVTTQDFSSLRSGPGRNFTRLTVVPPVITLPADGRSPDTRWIQVMYEGQRGWIASELLVWTGDVISLPVDGIDPEPFIRRAPALGVTTRETPIYIDWVAPENQAGSIPVGMTVEITGRLGGEGSYFSDFFRMQIRWEGALYWVNSHDIRPVDGNYFRLLDIAYLYPYGQLFTRLQSNHAITLTSFNQIADVWRRIGSGSQVSCAVIPPQVPRDFTPQDAAREPLFVAAALALDGAIAATNAAIIAFQDACAGTFPITSESVALQLADIAEANRALTLVSSFLEPLRIRNPLLVGSGP